tara:strand:+ start:1373 stop:2293 length:921 start_codon:yes stop_codon:yes gene_type:complete
MINKLRCKAELRYLKRRRELPVSSPNKVAQSPVFIVGSGRSGNTLLRRGLVEHTDLVIPPETYVLGEIIIFFYKHNSLGWNAVVKYAMAAFCFHPEFDDTFGINLSQLYRELIQVPEKERSLEMLLSSFYRYYAESKSVSSEKYESFRWGDKTPLNTYSVWDLYKVFPSAYFIGIYRDPVDVVASYVKSGIYSSIEGAALRWLNSNKILMEFKRVHPEICQIVRYENLVGNYESTIQELCNFCHLDYRSKAIEQALGDVGVREHHSNVLGSISSASVGKGRRELNAKQVEEVEFITSNFHSKHAEV